VRAIVFLAAPLYSCRYLLLKPPDVRSQQIVIMKLALSLLAAPAIAFTAPQTTPTRAATQLFAYVPSGMDPAAYAALKKKEAAASKKSDRKAYKSRSVQK